jgi:hypothetical protein
MLARTSHHSDTDAVQPLGRKAIAILAEVVGTGGLACFRIKRHRGRVASEQRRAAFAACKGSTAVLERRLESIKQDARSKSEQRRTMFPGSSRKMACRSAFCILRQSERYSRPVAHQTFMWRWGNTPSAHEVRPSGLRGGGADRGCRI